MMKNMKIVKKAKTLISRMTHSVTSGIHLSGKSIFSRILKAMKTKTKKKKRINRRT